MLLERERELAAIARFPCTDLVLYTAVLRLFESVSPLLVTVDDVDLWDQSSKAALLFTARRVSSVAIVLTAREGWNPGLPSLVLPGLPYQAILTEPEVVPNESLAARLEAHSADAARRGGIASAATVLRAAARLSHEPERQRRSAAAAYLAWKSGQSELARTLVAEATPERHDPAVAPTLDRLHGLIAFGDGDQLSAHDHLLRAGPDHAGLLARLTSLPLDAHTADPRRLRAAAPSSLRTSDAHQWLWPLVLSMSGPSAVRPSPACVRRPPPGAWPSRCTTTSPPPAPPGRPAFSSCRTGISTPRRNT